MGTVALLRVTMSLPPVGTTVQEYQSLGYRGRVGRRAEGLGG